METLCSTSLWRIRCRPLTGNELSLPMLFCVHSLFQTREIQCAQCAAKSPVTEPWHFSQSWHNDEQQRRSQYAAVTSHAYRHTNTHTQSVGLKKKTVCPLHINKQAWILSLLRFRIKATLLPFLNFLRLFWARRHANSTEFVSLRSSADISALNVAWRR